MTSESENLSWESYTVYECPECGSVVSESFIATVMKYNDYHKCEKEYMKCYSCDKEFLFVG
jgi:predicted RNA-binding Zn-ribbon protein involved in translation (DUF1610 family)